MGLELDPPVAPDIRCKWCNEYVFEDDDMDSDSRGHRACEPCFVCLDSRVGKKWTTYREADGSRREGHLECVQSLIEDCRNVEII